MLCRIVCLVFMCVCNTTGVYGQTEKTKQQTTPSPASTVGQTPPHLDIGPVTVLAMSPTKDVGLTGGGDGSLVLWDIDSTNLLAKPHRVLRNGRSDETGNPVVISRDDIVRAVGFSPDGNVLAASLRRAIEIRALSHPELVARTLVHPADVATLAISHDGHHLASGDTEGNLRIWDVRSGELLRAWSNSDHQLVAIAFDPGGKQVATVLDDGKTTLSNWADSTTVFSVQISGTGTHRAAADYSSDGQWLAVACLAGAKKGVWVLHGKTGHARALNVGGHAVMGAAFTPDGAKLIGLLANNTLLIWNSGDWTVQSVPLTSSNIRLGFNGLSLAHPGLLGLSGVEPATFHGHLEIKGFVASSSHKK
jgi:WD40 repeat protein